MLSNKLITSTQNSYIKKTIKLRDKKERDKTHLTIIDGFREIFVLDKPDGFARKIGKAFSRACGLHAAVVHPEYAAVFRDLDYFLPVDMRVEPEVERLDEGGNPAARFYFEKLHNPFRLDDGEFFPRGLIRGDRGVHPVRFFHGLKPDSVVGEPVLRRVN